MRRSIPFEHGVRWWHGAVLVAACLFLHAARACEGTCSGLFDVSMSGSERAGCQAELARCLQTCRAGGAPVRPLAPTVAWGFLVFDTATGRWGASSGHSSGMQARGAARSDCARKGGIKCDWQIAARGGCVAVAEGEAARGRIAHQKSGGREALAIARGKALANCAKDGGVHCRVVAEVCSH